MLKADEDGQMLFLHKEFLLYIFKWKWDRETWCLLTNQFNDKKRLLQCNVKYNDETIKI